jgi:hypothetical protein
MVALMRKPTQPTHPTNRSPKNDGRQDLPACVHILLQVQVSPARVQSINHHGRGRGRPDISPAALYVESIP